jgi:hypothetical protein
MISLGKHMVHTRAMLKGELKGETAEHRPVFMKKGKIRTYWVSGATGGHTQVFEREGGGYYHETLARPEVRPSVTVNAAHIAVAASPALIAALIGGRG